MTHPREDITSPEPSEDEQADRAHAALLAATPNARESARAMEPLAKAIRLCALGVPDSEVLAPTSTPPWLVTGKTTDLLWSTEDDVRAGVIALLALTEEATDAT